MRRVHVILSVPVEDDENPPRSWLWNALLDTANDVIVLDTVDVDLLPSDESA